MDKVLINLEVPSISEKYEILIPVFLKIGDVIELLIQTVNELSGGLYSSSGNEILCSRTGDFTLGNEARICDYDITDGDHLMIM